MKVEWKYERPLDEIVAEVLRMDNILESEQATLMDEIGKEIKKEVRKILPKTDENHKHMRDDIKVSVKGKKQNTGVTGVVVGGGKDTAYKWHILDDGTRNPDGTVHTPALHFTSKALSAAEPTIDRLLIELERKVVK